MESDQSLKFKLWLEGTSPPLSWLARNLVWWLNGEARRSRSRLGKLRNAHRGERCIIIGNGPSLNEMDLQPLKDETCFSLNRGYLLYDRIGSPCDYQVVINELVAEQFAGEIAAVDNLKFITWNQRRCFPGQEDIVYFGGPIKPEPPRFSEDVRWDMWSGATVTYAALQIAYHMGFQQVILIGVDHNFESKGPAHETITSSGEDLNHFDPTYFGEGVRWQLPDLATSELAYALARHYYWKDGREVLDATVGGKLQIFPKVNLREILSA